MSTRSARTTIGFIIPAVAIAVGYLPLLIVRDELPDRIASHFDASGTPDGSMTVTEFALASGSLILVGALVLTSLGLLHDRLDKGVAPLLGFLGGFLTGLGAGLLGATVLTQKGNASWQDASSAWLLLLAALAIATALGAWAARAGSKLPSTERSSGHEGPAPRMSLRPAQQAMWRQTLRSVWLFRGGVALVAGGILVAVGTFWWIALATTLSGLAMLTFASLDVRADRNGLRVSYGPFGWPSTTIPIDRIEEATVIDVRPMQWGGWGYRGSLKLMNQAAVVHRAGPGIRLDLDDDKVFVVTVDDPGTPAALLNAEVDRLSV